MRENENVLYHYTDYQALDGILRESQLRLNNVLNMNDASELRLFMRGLCEAVEKRFLDLGREETARQVRELFLRELKREFNYSGYAACFSLFRDEASQWERYGNRGRGVCIGFRRDLLERISVGAVSLKTVFYKDEDDINEHELVDVFCDLMGSMDRLDEENPKIREVLNEAWVSSAAFKHPSFAAEREVRLVVSPFGKEYFDVEPQYHVSRERIKKYYPLNLKFMCMREGLVVEDLITEIIIGPESTQSQPILVDYLKDNRMEGLADKVFVSDCPLRRTLDRM
ncbi:MAG: DUF2971 domain-containing protein [Firmicutes bacterium]|nr:DUF2971 domain-containing protein [Bacillota bacterium]